MKKKQPRQRPNQKTRSSLPKRKALTSSSNLASCHLLRSIRPSPLDRIPAIRSRLTWLFS